MCQLYLEEERGGLRIHIRMKYNQSKLNIKICCICISFMRTYLKIKRTIQALYAETDTTDRGKTLVIPICEI